MIVDRDTNDLHLDALATIRQLEDYLAQMTEALDRYKASSEKYHAILDKAGKILVQMGIDEDFDGYGAPEEKLLHEINEAIYS